MKLKAFLSEAFIFCWCCLVTAMVGGIAVFIAGDHSVAFFGMSIAAIAAFVIYIAIPFGEFIRGKIFRGDV